MEEAGLGQSGEKTALWGANSKQPASTYKKVMEKTESVSSQ